LNIKHNTCPKLYSIYHNMKYRCFTATCHAFKDYGGRGITVCDDWIGEEGYTNFYNWSIANNYQEGLSIDRINNDGNYEPSNCRWITKSKNTALANYRNVRRKANKGKYYGISPSGEYFEFDNANEFAKLYNLNAPNIRDVANGRKKTHYKWIFGFVCDLIEI
jgi:hypothetical protein